MAADRADALISRCPAWLATRVFGAALRPRPGHVPGYAGRVPLQELGGAPRFPEAQIEHLGELIIPLVTARAPACPG